MNKFAVALVFVICATLAGMTAFAATAPPETAGRAAAEEWLALVDAGKYPESWKAMDAGFRDKVSQRKWKSAIGSIRKPLGKLISRKFSTAQYSKELPGAPEGEYVVVQFEAAFANRKVANEKVTLILGQDLVWRVSGYLVK